MPYETVSSEVAWACGLFEGEGCAWLTRNLIVGREPYPKAGLSVTSTDRDVLERFGVAVGGTGRIHGPKNPGNRLGTRPVYQWMTQSLPEVQRVLRLFYLLLGERRRERADAILALRR